VAVAQRLISHPPGSTHVMTPFADRAAALYHSGRRAEAEEICLATVEREPANFDALHMLGALLSERGNWQGALGYFERAAALNGGNPFVHNNAGLALTAIGRPLDAIERFRKAIALFPGFADAHCNLGAALDEAGRDEEALVSLQAALALQPALARAHANRGSLLHKRRRLEEALASYDRALAIQPQYPSVQAKRGALLLELGQPEAALASLGRALSADPANVIAYVNRSAVLETLSRFDESLVECERAIAVQPASAVAHNARGSALAHLGRHAEALRSYQRAMELDPGYAEARWNASLGLLRLGRLSEGLALHEWRKRLPRPLGKRSLPGREWTDKEPLAGRTLLLYAEQGLGDTIQFCRYATLAARAGARVVLEVPAPLKDLLASVEGVEQVVTAGEPLPKFDLYAALLSLPLAFHTTLETIPAGGPYLRCDTVRLQAWRRRLGEAGKLRVGLVWSGGVRPGQPELTATNIRRNVPLARFACLRHPGIEFYSLQKGPSAEAELTAARTEGWSGPEIRDFSPLLQDFSDTAALVANLDLVITVDTSMAHLAGALGKPVWILNRFDSCWRWLVDRTDTPWYPSARLYRQERAGDWESVLQRVRTDLLGLATADAAVIAGPALP
jgi:tetratricopeptide (TPR) repeat protein